jgi:hypothetical protein
MYFYFSHNDLYYQLSKYWSYLINHRVYVVYSEFVCCTDGCHTRTSSSSNCLAAPVCMWVLASGILLNNRLVGRTDYEGKSPKKWRKFDVCGSVYHSITHIENPTRCHNVTKFYFIFIWSSTCFGRHTAHHQEPNTAQAASGFACMEGCWTCSCWTLSGRVYSAWQLRLLMMGGVSPEICWASYKYEIKLWYTVASCWIFYISDGRIVQSKYLKQVVTLKLLYVTLWVSCDEGAKRMPQSAGGWEHEMCRNGTFENSSNFVRERGWGC